MVAGYEHLALAGVNFVPSDCEKAFEPDITLN